MMLSAAKTRLDQGSNVTVFQNLPCRLACSTDCNIDHGAGQIVGPDDVIGKQHAERGIDCAQQAIAQIRFFARLHWVDVGGSEDVNVGKCRREQRFLGLSLVARERQPVSSSLIRAAAAQRKAPRQGWRYEEPGRTRLCSPR
jgi:hypothetical protein